MEARCRRPMMPQMHHHTIAQAIDLEHAASAMSLRCRHCGNVLLVWSGPTDEYGAALGDALDRVARHCGEHDIETRPDEIYAVLACAEDSDQA